MELQARENNHYLHKYGVPPGISYKTKYLYLFFYQLRYGNYNNSQTTWKLSKPKYQTQTTLEHIK